MNLVWFRHDLRTIDQPALSAACQSGTPVCGLFIISAKQWQQHHMASIQADFILRTLAVLQHDLAALNIHLHVIQADTFADVPAALLNFCSQHDIKNIYWNHQYEWNERQRDIACITALNHANIAQHLFHDQCLIAPRQIKTGSGDWYKVFTPFRNNWQKILDLAPPVVLPCPDALPDAFADTLADLAENLASANAQLPQPIEGFAAVSPQQQALWPAGEQEALNRLSQFVQHGLRDYATQRNRPDLNNATSQLSAYLAVGAISNKQCYVAAQQHLGADAAGHQWINELCWRDFYRHILVNFAHVSRGQAFNRALDANVKWSYDQADFKRWCDGKTGIPIVDAAMRCLQHTGWMHNRLRMVCAMFLSKNLLIDWRLGEQYFSQQLIDADLASNNGGWQWSASVGTDAAPYFRVMNPMTQGKTHDPDGRFILQWLPELAMLRGAQVHDEKMLKLCKNYPAPMVDLKQSRQAAIDAFKNE